MRSHRRAAWDDVSAAFGDRVTMRSETSDLHCRVMVNFGRRACFFRDRSACADRRLQVQRCLLDVSRDRDDVCSDRARGSGEGNAFRATVMAFSASGCRLHASGWRVHASGRTFSVSGVPCRVSGCRVQLDEVSVSATSRPFTATVRRASRSGGDLQASFISPRAQRPCLSRV